MTQDLSSKLGTSSSPIVDRVIENNKGVVKPEGSPESAVANKHTNNPVTTGGAK